MAEQTLLAMTQDILSEMSADEVNSISDTTESMQVATIIKNKYFDITARGQMPEHETLFQLDPSNDDTKPVLMYVPSGVSVLKWLKYFDTNPDDSEQESQFGSFAHDLNVDLVESPDIDVLTPLYKYVTILPVEQFLDMTNRNNLTNSDVGSFVFNENGKNFTFYYRNDIQPKFCTILENYYVIFDSFDKTQDSTLQASKTMCWGQKVPPFLMEDTFIPDLDDQQFPLLMNEAKALAFYTLKQQPHAKAEQEIKRQWSSVQKTKSITNKPSYFDQLPSFGRMPRTGGYGTIWPKITQSMN